MPRVSSSDAICDVSERDAATGNTKRCRSMSGVEIWQPTTKLFTSPQIAVRYAILYFIALFVYYISHRSIRIKPTWYSCILPNRMSNRTNKWLELIILKLNPLLLLKFRILSSTNTFVEFRIWEQITVRDCSSELVGNFIYNRLREVLAQFKYYLFITFKKNRMIIA